MCILQVALGQPGKAKFYSHMSGREEWRSKMIENFPKEEKAIDKYLQLLAVKHTNNEDDIYHI